MLGVLRELEGACFALLPPRSSGRGPEGFPPVQGVGMGRRGNGGSQGRAGRARGRRRSAGRRGERGAGGFAPGCARLPRRQSGFSQPSSPGGQGDGERAGSGKTRRLSHAGTAWH